ncbi:MAG: hypothetical protein AB8B50_07445 [Pirellulaceae bacterium]
MNATDPYEPRWLKVRRWLARIGVVGFAFFLLKGLVWVAIFFGVGQMLGC